MTRSKLLDSCKRLSLDSVETQNAQNANASKRKPDIHQCYQEAVQNPRKEIINLQQIYHTVKSDDAPPMRLLREDFCGTAILCAEWVSKHVDNEAVGVDLDEAVLQYGRDHFKDSSVSEKIQLVHANVLSVNNESLDKVDLLAALNYGVCYFHTYATLLKYFQQCWSAIKPGGVLVCDGFGGRRCQFEPVDFRRRCSHFDYIFEQSAVDLLTNRTICSINFKFKDEQTGQLGKKQRAFVYDFRAWSVAEMAEAMREAGFEQVSVWVGESQMMSNQDDYDCSDEDDDDEEEEEVNTKKSNAFIKICEKTPFKPTAEFWNVYIAARRPTM